MAALTSMVPAGALPTGALNTVTNAVPEAAPVETAVTTVAPVAV